ncbi:calpain-9-like [Arapaima gigas]
MPPPGVILDIIEQRNRREGVGSLENPLKFRGQDFHSLRQYCLSHRLRFVDDTFPPDSSSIGPGLLKNCDLASVVWKRPRDLVNNPQLFVEGVSRFDFSQGELLGNCWFLASLGAVTFQIKILQQVLPFDQSFEDDSGIFHFRFWRFGKWVDVVIDDKLPTINGKLMFVYPKTRNEFWPSLLEKAYAKLCGSYSDLNAGSLSEAMMDFTGGVHLRFKLTDAPPDLWDLMWRAEKHICLMGCGTPQGQTQSNKRCPSGLVPGHAYTVTAVTELRSVRRPVRLVRLWNPWCQGEWKGDWSDRSPLWNSVSVEERTKYLQIENNGEFWISMEDFVLNFDDLCICCLSPDFLSETDCHWSSVCHEGKWVAGVTAGGCIKYKETFWRNPQYVFTIPPGPQCSEHQGAKNTLVTLLQKSDKKHRHLTKNYHIGFFIYAVQKSKQKVPSSFFCNHNPVKKTEILLDAREVSKFFQLKPGHYIVVPSTADPNEAGTFILRIFSKSDTLAEECGDQHNLEFKKDNLSKNHDINSFQEVFTQYHDQYLEVNAEQLQMLLNEKVIKGVTSQVEGFALDTSRSIVAMMDLSVTGKLNDKEFSRLWKRVLFYRDIWLKFDGSRSGRLPLSKLQDAIQATGITPSDRLMNLLALRYSSSSGEITLPSFMLILLRLEFVNKTFRDLSKGQALHLSETEWLHFSIYS